jgi:tetratricopeptide (TPR) repeat protein
MYVCPACGKDGVVGLTACACGADLTLLSRLHGVADAWFNEGLAALRAGASGRALEWLSAACAARPADAEARRAQARVWAQLGRFEEAKDALARAAALDPASPDLSSLREALQAGAAVESAAPPAVARAAPPRTTERRAGRSRSRRARKRRR